MAYCIKNHILKKQVYQHFGWTIIGPGCICIRDEYARREPIKVCKNPEEETFTIEKIIYILDWVIAKVPEAPKIKSKVFTHEEETMRLPSKFEWHINTGEDRIYGFSAIQVGWTLYRLLGEKLKWHVVPRINGTGVLVFTNAYNLSCCYATITCCWSSEYERVIMAVGR